MERATFYSKSAGAKRKPFFSGQRSRELRASRRTAEPRPTLY